MIHKCQCSVRNVLITTSLFMATVLSVAFLVHQNNELQKEVDANQKYAIARDAVVDASFARRDRMFAIVIASLKEIKDLILEKGKP